MKKSFSSYCKLYESWKKKEHGVAGLNATEVKQLRESYSRDTAAKPTTRLSESTRQAIIARHRERLSGGKASASRVRESKKDAVWAKTTDADKEALRTKIREHFSARPAGKTMREGVAAKPAAAPMKEAVILSTADAAKRIREARKSIYTAKRALREGDMGLAGESLGAAGDAVNAVGAAGPAANLPPEITAAIQGIKSQVDELAIQAGIESPVDLGANPDAGIPPVDGGAIPAAPAPAPAGGGLMLEGKKREDELAAIRERIALRRSNLSKYKESIGAQTIGRNVVASLCVDKFKDPEHHLDAVDNNNPPTQIPEIPVKKVAAGSAKGVVRWPNKEVAAPAEPSTVSKEYKHKAPKIAESLDEQHVTKFLEKKRLSLDDIYKNGLLG